MKRLLKIKLKHRISMLVFVLMCTVLFILPIFAPSNRMKAISDTYHAFPRPPRFFPCRSDDARCSTSDACPTASEEEGTLPMAYVITPTYARLTQEPDLLRLCYTLRHVPRVRWILVEDSENKTKRVTDVLNNCPGPSKTHLTALSKKGVIHRGTQQRNAGLKWLRSCFSPGSHRGGVYFADDDNTYNLEVFEAVRWTRKISVWVAGFPGSYQYEGPKCTKGKVTGWMVGWGADRQFPIDMAAFSVGLDLILSRPDVLFNDSWPKGYLETRLLLKLNVSTDVFSPQPDENCSRILAWHTKTVKPGNKAPRLRAVSVKKTPPRSGSNQNGKKPVQGGSNQKKLPFPSNIVYDKMDIQNIVRELENVALKIGNRTTR